MARLRTPTTAIQRDASPGSAPRRRVLTLPVDDIQPAIRIAHHPSAGWLIIPERIILDHEFVLILRGEGRLVMRDRTIAFAPHQLLFIQPFVPHSFASTEAIEHVAVHFDLSESYPALSPRLERRRPYEVRIAGDLEIPPVLSLSPTDGLEDAFLDLVRHWNGHEPAGRLAARARLTGLIAALVRPRSAPQATVDASGPMVARERLRRALEAMRTRFSEPLTVEDLARTSGLSHSRFSHLFRELTGYAPTDYLRRLRIDEARRLLADIDLSIKQVAARAGFDDQYHFSRVFRQVDGLSPTLYREALLAARGSGAIPGPARTRR